MNKNILITGGAGFIGSHLIDYLLENGNQIIAIDNFSQGNLNNLSSAKKNPKFSLLELDITTSEFVQQLETLQPDMVFHLAFPVGVETVMQTEKKVFAEHFKSSLYLFDWAAKNKTPLFFASSSEVYGNPITETPLKESDVLSPAEFDLESSRFLYGKAKRELEIEGFKIFKKSNTSFIAGRYFNIFGPRQSNNQGMVIPRFLQHIQNDLPISVYGDGTQVRSFCPVSFAVKASFSLLTKEKPEQSAVNIGLPKSIQIKNLAEWMIQSAQKNTTIDFISIQNKPGRSEAIHTRIPDISTLLGKLPNIELPDFKQELINMIQPQKELLQTHE